VAEKGFPISVYNRSYDKTEAAVARAKKEGECVRRVAAAACLLSVHSPLHCRSPILLTRTPPHTTHPHQGLGDKLTGYKEVKDFVASLQKPR
jgi:6-phosphogluconate dehydrogenase